MTISIKDQRVDGMASQLAASLGASITEAVAVALEEKLAREQRLHRHRRANRLERMIAHVTEAPKGAAQALIDGMSLILPLADVIDLDQERARLGKESDRLAAEIKKIDAKLANQDFVDRAPPEVVEEQRERKAEMESMLIKLQAAQKSLAG